jgi:phosphate transport system substrate-binding protein
LAAPLINRWADVHRTATGVEVDYVAIGSGGGIKQLESKAVDFGFGGPLSFDAAKDADVVQWPLILGGVVPVVNLLEVSGSTLRLDG